MAAQTFNHWQAVADAIHPAAREAVRLVAADGAYNVRSAIRAKGLIRTGFMLRSVYWNSSDSSTYKGTTGFVARRSRGWQKRRRALKRSGATFAFPEVPRPSLDTEANIAVTATYARYPNYGTVHMAARPFFEPGIERTKQDFDKRMRRLKQRIEKAAQ